LRTTLWALAAALLALLIAWGVWAFATPLASASTPDGTVLRYYQLMSRGRVAEAQSLYAPELTAAWFGSLSRVPVIAPSELFGAYGMRTDAPGSGAPDTSQGHDYTRSYRQFADVGVYFTQWWGNETISPGGQYRDVLLGRKGPGSPWVILEQGTGG
jgi:hypothetical protein